MYGRWILGWHWSALSRFVLNYSIVFAMCKIYLTDICIFCFTLNHLHCFVVVLCYMYCKIQGIIYFSQLLFVLFVYSRWNWPGSYVSFRSDSLCRLQPAGGNISCWQMGACSGNWFDSKANYSEVEWVTPSLLICVNACTDRLNRFMFIYMYMYLYIVHDVTMTQVTVWLKACARLLAFFILNFSKANKW